MGPCLRLLVLLLLLPAACTLSTTDEVYRHALVVDGDGDPAAVLLLDGDLAGSVGEDFNQQFRRMTDSAEFKKAERFLIYVHGGLNSLSDGLKRSGEHLRLIRKDLGPGVYPIFINWESGMEDAYFDHLFRIRHGSPRVWAWATMPFFFLADLGRALTRSPIVMVMQSADLPELIRRIRPDEVPPLWKAQARIDPRVEKGAGPVALDWATSLTLGLLRPVTTLLFDTVAFASYPLMLRRVDTLFRRDKDLNDAREPSRSPTGALTLLMKALPPEKPVTLIGHSMGTIILNELVRHHPNRSYDRIVYMAAACTIEDFANAIPGYLKSPAGAQSRFHLLTLHPEADRSENVTWSILPHGSLLRWLDIFVLGPRTKLQKTLGQWNNLVECLGALEPDLGPVRDRIFIKGFPIEGKKYPYEHGSFDEFPYWRSSFWDPADTTPPLPKQ